MNFPRTNRLTARTVGLALTVILVFPGCGGIPGGTPGGRGAELRVRWVLPEAFPAQISLHRALDNQPAWQMRTYAAGEPVAVSREMGEEIVNGNMRVTLDEPQHVVVVLRNPLDRAVRFWVAPHLPTPHSAEAALMTRCLCTGETYEVPAHGTWTRVVELGIRRRGAVDTLIITHVVTLGDAPSAEALPTGSVRSQGSGSKRPPVLVFRCPLQIRSGATSSPADGRNRGRALTSDSTASGRTLLSTIRRCMIRATGAEGVTA